MKIILVPTDFSKSAHNACMYAIEIAKKVLTKIFDEAEEKYTRLMAQDISLAEKFDSNDLDVLHENIVKAEFSEEIVISKTLKLYKKLIGN